MSFQDGVLPNKDYLGTRDTYLSENKPDTVFGTAQKLRVDGSDPGKSNQDLMAVLFWDLSELPEETLIKRAIITIDVTNPSRHSYRVYAINPAWEEAAATWHSRTARIRWGSPGAKSDRDRREGRLGNVQASSEGHHSFTLNADGLAVVQGWVDGTFENNGFAIANSKAKDGLTFRSRETTDPAIRPKLTLGYLCGDPDNITDCPEPSAPAAQQVQPPKAPATKPAVADSIPAATSDQQRKIQTAQLLLAELGYDPGLPDGTLESKTRAAIVQFQTQSGMTPDGQVSDALLIELSKAKSARR
jgi:hypothetical protein